MATLSDEVRGVLALLKPTHVPNADELRAHFEKPGRTVTISGPKLESPPWGIAVSGMNDIFVELEPDSEVWGARVWNDSRGWGSSVQLTMRRGTVAELEPIIGALEEAPRSYQKLETSFAAPTVAGHRVPVYVHHIGDEVRVVEIRLQNNQKT